MVFFFGYVCSYFACVDNSRKAVALTRSGAYLQLHNTNERLNHKEMMLVFCSYDLIGHDKPSFRAE